MRSRDVYELCYADLEKHTAFIESEKQIMEEKLSQQCTFKPSTSQTQTIKSRIGSQEPTNRYIERLNSKNKEKEDRAIEEKKARE